jgi:hypothetical protein
MRFFVSTAFAGPKTSLIGLARASSQDASGPDPERYSSVTKSMQFARFGAHSGLEPNIMQGPLSAGS